MSRQLAEWVGRFPSLRVLVLGDVMLDRFVYGSVRRISPEAPIPVLSIEQECRMAGGAGNVARNIAALGGKTVLIGLVGKDADGAALAADLAAAATIDAVLIESAMRPTTAKTRFVAGHQQILRADTERAMPATVEAGALLEAFVHHLPSADAVVLSDYAKGVLSDALLQPALKAARAAGVPVIVDPKGSDVSRYDGASLMTPNRFEAMAATHISGEDDAAMEAAGAAILAAAPALGAALITRGARGMLLCERGQAPVAIKALVREVFDVSGAGDTAVAGLALMLAAGASHIEAAHLANLAAGIAVGHVGTAAISADQLLEEMQAEKTQRRESKIVSQAQAAAKAAQWREHGAKVGFTNGCFDLIHPGHVALLDKAKAACDRLIVGLNRDESVRRLKGDSRPIQNESARAAVLASMEAVDLVVPFGEDTPEALIEAIRPDVLVKGADYRIDQVVGADFVSRHGGCVLLVDLVEGHSTTATVRKMEG